MGAFPDHISRPNRGAYLKMRSTTLSKKGHVHQYVRHLLAIACISLLLFAFTSGTSAFPRTSGIHASEELSATWSGLEAHAAPLPCVTNLNHTAGRTWINWTWTNRGSARFTYARIHLNGNRLPEIMYRHIGFAYGLVYLSEMHGGATPESFYNMTGLKSGTCYEIGLYTVDVSGNTDETWVNQTAETTRRAEFMVRTSDGLEFNLTEDGTVTGMAIDDSRIPMLFLPGGFSFGEVSSTTPGIPLSGTVEKNPDGSITEHVISSDIAFKFDYIPKDRYVEVHGDIQDMQGVDRAIQVQYVLPVNSTGWQWDDDIRKSRKIESGTRYENVYKIGDVRTQNTYPFTFVGDGRQGICLAVPMDVPRIYRIGYDTDAGGYLIEYDFGLSNCTDKIGAGHANFTFILYRVDEPEWGFRAAAKKYYELYPVFFVKKNDREGLWVIDHQMNMPDVADFGFVFTDSHCMPPSERIFNEMHGIYSMEYSEPWGYRTYFGDDPAEPSYKEKIARLDKEIVDGTDPYEYVIPRSQMASSVLETCPLDKNGNQYLLPCFWEHFLEWSQSYPMNPDPDIPGLNRFDVSYLEYSMDNGRSSSVCAHNWTPTVVGWHNWHIADDVSRTGSYSAKLDIGGTDDATSSVLCSDLIAASPSTQYVFSAWGRTYHYGGFALPAVRAAEYAADGTYITQRNLHYGHGTNDWAQKSMAFTTTPDTATIRICNNIYGGHGTFWVDDVSLSVAGTATNLVRNSGFESTEYVPQCDGLRLDSLSAHGRSALLENYRRRQWAYTDHPLVFSYDTRQPVLLGTLSQYEYLAAMQANMSDAGKRLDANMFSYAYSFYGHLIDVQGSEVWELRMGCADASLHRTMSYQKTNRNLLNWDQHGNDPITHKEMETYINDQMFYGMFPGIWYASGKRDDYWADATLYGRDRGLFKRYVPLIKAISSAGWDPIPYATVDNRNIKFERYGDIEDGLYYTVGNSGSATESGVVSVDLSKFGFGGGFVEVQELVTDVTSTQEVVDGGVVITIQELHPHETRVYRISP
ncbi:MAG: hypothetical protein U9Q37_01765 [Euryarchaeota archaeon]|nr:hypothetical protein [Euryarchaeota archaeon]